MITSVHGLGYFFGITGYSVHTQNFFAQLQRKLPTVCSDIRYTDTVLFNKAYLELRYEKDSTVNIGINYGNSMNYLRSLSGKRIGYTVWESTKIPDDWIEPLNNVNEIWIPSYWGKKVLEKNGFSSKKVKVIQEGVDSFLFNPKQIPRKDVATLAGYKFLYVGQYGTRKGTKELIYAFDEVFSKSDNVFLIMSCHSCYPQRPNFNLKEELAQFSLKNPEKIIPLPPQPKHQSIAELYTACDAYVSPNRAEGWGLTITEAMACGLPVIVTYYGGQTEYLTHENAYLLDYSLIDVHEPFFKSTSGDYGQWAQPDIEHLKYLLRYLYENQEEGRYKGSVASHDVLNNWTWEKAAERAYATLMGVR